MESEGIERDKRLVKGVLPTVVSPGAIWAQVEPGLESEALLANWSNLFSSRYGPFSR
jgi:hypothetical protein